MTKAIGYAAQHSYSRLKPISFERDDPKANEVEIEVLFCGVCHSDIHQVKIEWSNKSARWSRYIVSPVVACQYA